ncbi:PREDICTED: TBC1 domain family member 16 [Nicrophorus vespilloides]|uniref:TBC1 domain family member 16 n=1 Tax=Nicrophorus vespilloides TaxID=110193 RepID=A0ABM1NAZ4_NICVS|nr:PREDICTED: TBC1 domain family member 16 [Nicrophorus vespilloides]XP_017783994.1 PREDICTED: TBC1 domain family member 16 [Nicrophorus vespilloides]XP_017784001.1 PREDICTED: TBC1 domain family member 16 [Nicrophorus vespilloides]
MPLADVFRRASTYILGSELDNERLLQYEDNEVLFCKNNVCVHPPAIMRQDTDILHHPGYLAITTKTFVDQYNDAKRPTLMLTWIPNSTLKKCPHTLQNSPAKRNGYNSYSKQTSVESLTSLDSCDDRPASFELKSTNPFLNYEDKECNESISSDESSGSGGGGVVVEGGRGRGDKPDMININVEISNPDIEIISTPDSVKEDEEKFEFTRSESMTSTDSQYNWLSTPEFLAQKHNLAFPDSATCSPILPTKLHHKCRRFSVDLSQMRSLRLFFNDTNCTCGQLVVASRESQYKILHFHHGGLDHLAQVLHQWHSLLHSIKYAKGCEENLPYRHFMVCRAEVSDLELHPEEGQVNKLTEEMFRGLFNESGQLEDDLMLRKTVFFAGMERNLRKEVWPFLLHCYPYQSTFEERAQIAEIRRQEYEEVTRRRLELTGGQLGQFRRKVQSVVEKDVVRTDRANPFFAGEDNPNLEVMKNVLLNYAVYNPGLGYTQGMSDLLAPVLFELRDEVAAFWCFVGLMQRAVFVATPTDRDMDRSLKYLRELVRIIVPKFHDHLQKHKDANELLFCHRWILLCFKREFTEAVALRMWEACWANYLTDYFHLFLCLAIICVYADDVIAQDLRADEMLLHFSSLAMYMDGQVIARKARGLLHQFRQLREIPCTLSGLCMRCGPGIWDSSHSPRIYCSGHEHGYCPNTIVQ